MDYVRPVPSQQLYQAKEHSDVEASPSIDQLDPQSLDSEGFQEASTLKRHKDRIDVAAALKLRQEMQQVHFDTGPAAPLGQVHDAELSLVAMRLLGP